MCAGECQFSVWLLSLSGDAISARRQQYVGDWTFFCVLHGQDISVRHNVIRVFMSINTHVFADTSCVIQCITSAVLIHVRVYSKLVDMFEHVDMQYM